MVFQVSSLQRAASTYYLQEIYGKRVRTYKSNEQVAQAQNDRVKISRAAIENFSEHRKRKDEKQRITYSNPRLSNASL